MGGSISILPQPRVTVKSLWRCLNSVAGMYLCCWQGLCQRAGDVLGMRIGSFCDLVDGRGYRIRYANDAGAMVGADKMYVGRTD
jgi:hypothetical protein